MKKSSGAQLSPDRLRQHDCGSPSLQRGPGWDPAVTRCNNPGFDFFFWQLYHLSAPVCVCVCVSVLRGCVHWGRQHTGWLTATSSSPPAASSVESWEMMSMWPITSGTLLLIWSLDYCNASTFLIVCNYYFFFIQCKLSHSSMIMFFLFSFFVYQCLQKSWFCWHSMEKPWL